MSYPDLTDQEREAVAMVLQTPRLSIGPQVEMFEAAVAEWVDCKHAIAVSSGTSGLHLSVRAANIADGDWVITTPFSFVSSANVLLYERAVPIFVDVDPHTGNIDPGLVAQAAADLCLGGETAERWLPRRGVGRAGKLKAVLAVDVFGQPADYDALSEIAHTHDLVMIEDSCEALGASYRGRPAGNLADLGVFAFYPNKQITSGEGGMVITDRSDWADLIRALRNQGREAGDTWLQHTHLGYNYRLNELNGALGRVQMSRLGELLEKRRRVAGWYSDRVEAIPGVHPPRVVADTTSMSWFVYVIQLNPGIDQKIVMQGLEASGIPNRPYFPPIHLQPFYMERFGYREGDYPISEDLGQRGIALPFSSVMEENQVDQVCQVLAEVMETIT
jgi:perosamine synthetase